MYSASGFDCTYPNLACILHTLSIPRSPSHILPYKIVSLGRADSTDCVLRELIAWYRVGPLGGPVTGGFIWSQSAGAIVAPRRTAIRHRLGSDRRTEPASESERPGIGRQFTVSGREMRGYISRGRGRRFPGIFRSRDVLKHLTKLFKRLSMNVPRTLTFEIIYSDELHSDINFQVIK